jgi:hypothetical protein
MVPVSRPDEFFRGQFNAQTRALDKLETQRAFKLLDLHGKGWL